MRSEANNLYLALAGCFLFSAHGNLGRRFAVCFDRVAYGLRGGLGARNRSCGGRIVMTKLFSAEDFFADYLKDDAENCELFGFQAADRANSKLAPLVEVLEAYEHSTREGFMRRQCGDAVLNAYRALRDGKKPETEKS